MYKTVPRLVVLHFPHLNGGDLNILCLPALGSVAHEILETAQSPNSSFLFLTGLGIGTIDSSLLCVYLFIFSLPMNWRTGNLCWSGLNMWAEGPSINQPLSLIPLMHLTRFTECWLVRQTLFCDLIGWCWVQLKIHSVDHRSPPLQTGDRSVLFIKSGPDQGQQEIRFVFCRRIYVQMTNLRHDFLFSAASRAGLGVLPVLDIEIYVDVNDVQPMFSLFLSTWIRWLAQSQDPWLWLFLIWGWAWTKDNTSLHQHQLTASHFHFNLCVISNYFSSF